MRFLIAAAVCSLLGACAGSLPGVSQQGVAGITDVEVHFKDTCSDPSLPGCLSSVRWRDGKESASLKASLDLSTGTFNYDRSDVRAFDGQRVRAAVEKVVAEQVGNVTPGVVDAIVRAVITSIVPIPGALP